MKRKQARAVNVTLIPATITNQRRRVAAYARVSSSSEDQMHSYHSQIEYYSNYISGNPDWEFVGMYADEGITGLSTEKRDQLLQMLQDCRDGKIDLIIIKSISRLSRNVMDSLSLMREIRSYGVVIIFEKEDFDTSRMTSENIYTLQSLYAQKESAAISSNMRMGVKMRMINGTYRYSNPPYGYRKDEDSGRLVIHPQEARVVARIFQDYLHGMGTAYIARRLTEEAIPRGTPDKPQPWSQSGIIYMLKNPIYLGDSLWRKSYSVGETEIKKRKNYGEEDRILHRNTHPAIIDRVTFEAVQELCKQRGSKFRSGAVTAGYFFSGKLTCAHCQGPMRAKSSGGKMRWVCRKHDQDKDSCPLKPVAERSVRMAFVGMYNTLRLHRDTILNTLIKDLEHYQDYVSRKDGRVGRIEIQLMSLAQENEMYARRCEAGKMTLEDLGERSQAVTLQMMRLRQEKRQLLKTSEGAGMIRETEALRGALEQGPEWLEDVNEVMYMRLIDKAVVRSNTEIAFHLKGGLVLTERLALEGKTNG